MSQVFSSTAYLTYYPGQFHPKFVPHNEATPVYFAETTKAISEPTGPSIMSYFFVVSPERVARVELFRFIHLSVFPYAVLFHKDVSSGRYPQSECLNATPEAHARRFSSGRV